MTSRYEWQGAFEAHTRTTKAQVRGDAEPVPMPMPMQSSRRPQM